eukprot:scaffold23712_cov32-Tisochrysis_lutea.AAC.3
MWVIEYGQRCTKSQCEHRRLAHWDVGQVRVHDFNLESKRGIVHKREGDCAQPGIRLNKLESDDHRRFHAHFGHNHL